MEIGFRTVTRFNKHELEVIERGGRPVLVKRFSSRKRWERELWARSVLEARGCSISPEVYWSEGGDGRYEIGMEVITREPDSISEADLGTVRRFGRELGHMHALCAEPTDHDDAAWLEERMRLIAGLPQMPPHVVAAAGTLLERSLQLAPMTLIHRDLTDANMLVDHRRVWLIDWEVATIGHPDLDLTRLRPSLSHRQLEAFHSSYREGWSRVRPWHEERMSLGHRAAFELVYCGEIWKYLTETGQDDSDFARETLDLAVKATGQIGAA